MKNSLLKGVVYILFLISLGLGMKVYSDAQVIQQKNTDLELSQERRYDQGAQIAELSSSLSASRSLLSDALASLRLLTTFSDAGFSLSPREVRDLLVLAKSLPYGSPFVNGHRITSQFGMRSIARFGWIDKKHLGIDLLPLDGDPTIIAPVDGYITDHGWSDLYGYYIEMQTTTGYRLFMAHLSRIYWPHVDSEGNWSLDPKQVVKQGSRIAQMGETGKYATGPHLHYEIWIQTEENGWVPLDPEEIINFTGG